MDFALDHIVYALPDLDLGCEAFADLTGIKPALGGTHPNMGTQNALVSFGDRVYLELFAPNPECATPKNLGGRLAALPTAQLFAWSLQTAALEEACEALVRAGLIPTPPAETSRMQISGEILHWDLAGLRNLEGAWPFFISWRDSTHPSTASPKVGALLHFEATLPIAELATLPFAAANGLELKVGPPAIALAFDTPNGPVEWAQSEPIGFFGF